MAYYTGALVVPAFRNYRKKSVRIIIGAKHNAHTDLLFKDLTLSKVTDISILQ